MDFYQSQDLLQANGTNFMIIYLNYATKYD